MQHESRFLTKNLCLLQARNVAVSESIQQASADPTISIVLARSGHSVPCQLVEGRRVLYHSTYDPVAEGQRQAEAYKPRGFLLFLGLGAGYHIRPFLESEAVSQILIVEKDAGVLRSIFEQIDLSPLLADPRSVLLVDQPPAQVNHYLLEHYLPVIDGDLQTVFLRPRLDIENDYFRQVLESVKQTIPAVSNDYAVQTRFGKRWFANTLLNLPAAQRSCMALNPTQEALVVGAGPSLEMQIDTLKKMRKSALLITSDTSLAALLAHNVVPDIVVSIDCQHITYHHFLQGLPQQVSLVLDLASPPALTRLSDRTFFFASRHPFASFVAKNWRELPLIDTSGGNVAHAALSLAKCLGAGRIHLFGLDFSYPDGKAYARGTYIYHFFRSTEDRLTPLESSLFSFIQDRCVHKADPRHPVYTSALLLAYRDRMEHAAAHMPARVIQVRGRGLSLRSLPGPSTPPEPTARPFAAGPCKSDWRVFLADYSAAVRQLPRPQEPVRKYLRVISGSQRDLWLTLLPAAAALKRSATGLSPADLLQEVRAWSLLKIDRALDS